MIHERRLFSSTGSGIVDVVDIKTGKLMRRKRMNLGQGRVDSSLSLAQDRLYIQITNGTTVVLEPTSAEVARNKGEGSSSSPFFVKERILFRTPNSPCLHRRQARANGIGSALTMFAVPASPHLLRAWSVAATAESNSADNSSAMVRFSPTIFSESSCVPTSSTRRAVRFKSS